VRSLADFVETESVFAEERIASPQHDISSGDELLRLAVNLFEAFDDHTATAMMSKLICPQDRVESTTLIRAAGTGFVTGEQQCKPLDFSLEAKTHQMHLTQTQG
jgi:hypothetical protein